MPEEIAEHTPTEKAQEIPLVQEVNLEAPKQQTVLKQHNPKTSYAIRFIALLLIFFGASFGGGYVLAQKTQKPSIVQRADPSEQFAQRFGKKLDENGTTTFEFFTDPNKNERKDPGEAVGGVTVEIRKSGAENAFQYSTSNLEGITTIYGLPAGTYEARYSYNNPNQWQTSNPLTFSPLFQMLIDGKPTLLATSWTPLTVQAKEETFSIPLTEYKSKFILVFNERGLVTLTDPTVDRPIATIYTSDKYDIISRAVFQKENELFFLNRNNFSSLKLTSSYQPYLNTIFPNITSFFENDDLLSTSPNIKTIIYPATSSNGYYPKYASSIEECGKEGAISSNNESIDVGIMSGSGAKTFSLGDDTHVVFLGHTPNQNMTFMTASCSNGSFQAKKMRIRFTNGPTPDFTALDGDTILFSGSFAIDPPQNSTQSATQLAGVYLYHHSTDEFTKLEGNFPDGSFLLSPDRQWLIAPYDGNNQVTFVRVQDLLRGKVVRVSDSAKSFFGDTSLDRRVSLTVVENTVVSQFRKSCNKDRTCAEIRVGKITDNRVLHEKTYTLENYWNGGSLVGILENPYEK